MSGNFYRQTANRAVGTSSAKESDTFALSDFIRVRLIGWMRRDSLALLDKPAVAPKNQALAPENRAVTLH